MTRTRIAGAVVLAAVLAVVAPAQAAPGDLDPLFSGDGKVTTDFDGYDEAHGVALLQPDGKLVVVGRTVGHGGHGWEFALGRYNADGTLDTTFSGDGKQTTEPGGGNGFARGVAIQPDRKIVVVGHAGEGGFDFAVARYNQDGSLDPSFSGDGKELTDMTGYSDTASDVTIQPDGRIVVAGRAGDDFGVARYNADGALDATFSDDGKQTTHLGPVYASDGADAVAVQGDGKIVLAGTTDPLPPCDFSIDFCEDPFADFALVRYNADGTLDTAFSDDGKQITTDFGANAGASAVALGPDGKIVAAGYDGGDFALARYNPDGTLDDSFAGDGTQTTDFDGTRNDQFGVGDEASGVALQPDGKILAAGEGNRQFGLARYNLDGSLDASFSGDGKQTTEFGGSATASGVVLQPDGKIVAAGTTVGAGGVVDFALARYEGGSAASDTTPPETTITGGPTGTTSDSNATFSFDSSEGGSTFECRVDDGAFSPCSSPHTSSPLSGGSHSFEVRATDGADNTDPTPASRSWTIVPDYRTEVLGTAGLVSYWRLGETSGATAADAKGANTGTYRNGVLLGRPSALLHDANPSAGFDGSNDYVDVADHASLDTGDLFTLEAWFTRSSTASSTKTVLSKGNGSWRLSFVNNVLTLTKSGSGTVATASVSTTDTTGFHHVVATKSGATVKLYIDGVDRTGSVTNRTIANTSTALTIGRHTAGSEHFPGLIDEVAIYNVALSTAQVHNHFKASGR